MCSPVAARRHTEGKAREEQKETGGQPALEVPDVEPRALLVLGSEQGADRVAVQHEDERQEAAEVDEDDTVRVRAPGGTVRNSRNSHSNRTFDLTFDLGPWTLDLTFDP